jgi:hypothetical protein
MKKLAALFAICLSLSLPSFGSEHVVTRSAKVAGKGTYKAGKGTYKVTKGSVKGTGKVLKKLF